MSMEEANLTNVFSELDDRIEMLRKKVEKHRKYSMPVTVERHGSSRSEKKATKTSQKCHWVCENEKSHDAKVRCLEHCSKPIVNVESFENLERDFPIDVKRIRHDTELRQTFERHQRAPQTIKHNMHEALDISDMYAMPIATIALPEMSWSQAMDVMKNPEYEAQLELLSKNWHDRASDYSPEAKEELLRKIERHDTNDILANAISKNA